MAARDSALLRQVPNALTSLRLLVVPVFIGLYVANGDTTLAIGLLFLAAAFTDFFDGQLARRLDVSSAFGRLADPLADRLLVGSAAVLLCAYDGRFEHARWAFLPIVGRDVLSIVGFAVVRSRQRAPEVSQFGKLGTALLLAGLTWLLLLPHAHWPLWLFWPGVAISVGAWLQYLYHYRWVFGGEVPAPGPKTAAVQEDARVCSRGADARASVAHEEENDGSPA